MNEKTFKLLEFNKVLDQLAGFAASDPGAGACRGITPLPEEELPEARELLRQWMAWASETGFSLAGFPDLAGFLDTLGRTAGLPDIDDLVTVLHVLEIASEALDAVKAADLQRFPDLAQWSARLQWPEKSFAAVKRCVDPDGLLRDRSSPELFAVREEIRSVHRKCTKKVKDFLNKEDISRYLQEEFMTVSSDRYVLPLMTNFKGRIKGIVHDYSQTGETCYFEPLFLVELNNQLQEFKQEEREAERKVFEYLGGLLKQERSELEGVYGFLLEADVLMAKSRYSAAVDARPLDISRGLPLNLKEVYHPLLKLRVRDAEVQPRGEEAVPLDVELREGQKLLVVSGGNAGGKTVCLKTVGLAALMGLSNIPVPAAEGSSLPTWNRVYVLLGDQQSLEDSLSTFTAQIDSLSRYWGNIDESSLVIMDEFGAGTDPTQGAALAQSVLDSLLKRGAWAMAATHFPALKAHALAAEGVRSASVLFDPGTKRPLFRLAYDQAGESRALNVARERGLPAEILERAEKYLLLEGSDGSAVMDRLNELAVNRERELERLEAERRRLEEKRGKLAENFEREKEKLLREMKAGSQEIVRQWQQGRKSRKKALSDLAALREKVAAAGDETESPRAPQGPVRLDMDTAEPGMRVRYEAFGKEGVIRERDERKGQVKVDMDGVSMWVAASDLTAPGRRSGEKTGGMSYESAGGPGGLYLDLRGFRADEARQELLRFLDRAVLSGHDSLEVVHGKGTGALRREVRDVLQNSPVVSNFELGPEDAGGDGMTKVQLR